MTQKKMHLKHLKKSTDKMSKKSSIKKNTIVMTNFRSI